MPTFELKAKPWGIRRWLVAALILTCGALARPGLAEDWPCWRGPSHDGVSTETGWLDHWPTGGPPVAWKASVGTGFSSICVAGGRAFTAGNSDDTDTLYCFDAESGKLLWKHSYSSELGDKFFEGGPTATAAVEAGRVYFNSRWGDVFCLDAATGKVIWTTNVPKETGCRTPDWGFGGSPLLFKNLVVLNMCEAGAALDKATGKFAWHTGKKDAGYSTPLPIQRDGKWIGLFSSGTSYIATELETGKEVWRVRWLTQQGVNTADPVVAGDKILISSGYAKGAELLKMGAGEPSVVWKSRELHTHLSPAVRVGEYVYGNDGNASDGGPLKCIDLANGQAKWEYPNVGSGGLIVADGKLIAMTEKGELMVAPATPEGFKPTARAQVLGGKTWAPPVLANGYIYCRNARGDVVCLDVKKK